MIRLNKFNPVTMTEGHISLVIGLRGTGKTMLIQDMLLRSPRADGILISGAEHRYHEYSRFFGHDMIYDAYDPSLIALVTDHSALVMDDCLYNMDWVKDDAVQKHFANNRGIATFISMLYPMVTDVDYVFLCRESYEPSLRRLYERFCKNITDYEAFYVMMRDMRSDGSYLVVDCRKKKLYYHTVDVDGVMEKAKKLTMR